MASNEQFQACLNLLRGDLDEQKFVGLTLVAKLLGSQEAEKGDDFHQKLMLIFEAVGFSFLNRLLKSSSEQRTMFEAVAVNVISMLCVNSDIVPHFLPLIPEFVAIFNSRNDAQILEEILKCLVAFAYCENDGAKGVEFLDSADVIADITAKMPLLSPDLQKYCIIVLDAIISNSSSTSSNHLGALTTLCHLFRIHQDLMKFDILQSLARILQRLFQQPSLLKSFLAKKWRSDLKQGIIDVLSNRVQMQHTFAALMITQIMLEIFGESWAVDPLPIYKDVEIPEEMVDDDGEEKGDDDSHPIPTLKVNPSELPPETTSKLSPEEPGYFIQILFTRVAIESRVILESGLETEECCSVLSCCFAITEHVISYLCSSEEAQEDTEEKSQHMKSDSQKSTKMLSQLQSSILLLFQRRLKEIFTAIFFYLLEARSRSQEEVLSSTSSNIVLGCIKLVGLWMMEETEELRDELFKSLRFMLTFQCSHEIEIDPLTFLLPGLVDLVLDEKPRSIVLSSNCIERVVATLKNHLNQLQNINNSPKDDNFSKGSNLHPDLPEILSCCEFLRNLLFADPNIAKEQLIFTEFLTFLLLPPIIASQRNRDSRAMNALANSLCCTLFILRSFKNVDKTFAEELDTFWSTCVNFFSESSFELLGDIWFISCSALADCINDYPSLVETIIKSGWLMKIPNIKEAPDPCFRIYDSLLVNVLLSGDRGQHYIFERLGNQFQTVHQKKFPNFIQLLSARK